ncbi:hypothetical protein HPB48_019175 [Haemaphysalis longicornis]|uniref:Orn/DAP/Arg decarboxylase 2 C-terminal domain-containing protein n=1 Tax=Haemaphysalis longicornis TaxID=44386 RepID=A0A9J6FZT3_HAELO|nr:hypothetical protein HPB48_019175 [Haemaphysalis longicornis]
MVYKFCSNILHQHLRNGIIFSTKYLLQYPREESALKITTRQKVLVFQPPYERPRNQLTSLWGATCHPSDVFEDGVPFFGVSVGEWLLMDNMGAYSMVKACGFNGCGFPPVHYRTESEDVERVSCILQDSRLPPGYSQFEEYVRNAPTSAKEPEASV